MRLSAAVIGLGQIGMQYDYHIKDDHLVLTHTAGYSHHYGYQLIGGVDLDKEKCNLFTKKYNLPVFSNIKDLFNYQRPDVISIAVPTQYHFSVFEEIISYSPKAIVCEKPLAYSLEQAKKMILMAENYQCVLLVNYIRRFEPGLLRLKQMLNEGIIGEIYKITVTYSKGLYNNGSHYIDLLLFLFGKLTDFKIMKKNNMAVDPEPDFYCRIGLIDVFFIALKDECFVMHEIIFIGTKGIVRYQQGGAFISLQQAHADPVFSHISTLANEITIVPQDMNRYQWHVCDHLYRHMVSGHELHSNGATALDSLTYIEKIINRIKVYEQETSLI